MHEVLQPAGWPRPKGYANGIKATGATVFTAGVIGWSEQEVFEHTDLVGQLRQILVSTKAILAEGGAGPEHIVRMTWYVCDRKEYAGQLAEIGAVWREIMGRVFPCMTCVQVAGLIEDAARIEIETTAIVSN